MSDSETDLLPNIVSFQSQGTTISARGPHIKSTSISSLGFRNNVMTSTMNMPWNRDRPRYAGSMYDQRSMSFRREREVSPMSFQSASGMQPRHYQHSYYHREGVGSHRSMYNGRSGSPMSVRSFRTMDSNTSLSAKDIVFALQNGSFNKFDKEIIKDAFHKCFKSRFLYRKRVEKKRNIRKFLNGFRRKSGGDSGDQASDSSISSDDCRSTKSSRPMYHRGNMSRSIRIGLTDFRGALQENDRSTKTTLTDFRRALRENDMIRDCTDNFRQNSFNKILPVAPLRAKETTQPKWQPPASSHNEKFRSGFLPPERFIRSVVPSNSEKLNELQSINEDDIMLDIRYTNKNQKPQETKCNETDSENDEQIFGEVTVMENINKSKRNLDEEDILVPAKKRSKLSPQTQMKTIQKSKDFIFAKPQLPLKKANIIKSQPRTVAKKPQHKVTKQTQEPKEKEKKVLKSPEPIVEKLISSSQKTQAKLIVKSTHPVNTKTSLASTSSVVAKVTAHDPPLEREPCPQTDITLLSATDMSVRPSFIKRKLFTQKVADAEKNSSFDSVQADSPQNNIYSKIQKEKNRARKLASQSCLNRDVADDSNLLDLIHKIVPPDQMNITAINRSELPNNKSKPVNHTTHENDKWDVTSIISTCNNKDNISDTFTDEEIFANDSKERLNQNKVTKQKKVTGEDTTTNHQNQKKDKINKKNTSNDKKKKNNDEKKDKQKDTNMKVATEKPALTQNDTSQKTTPPNFLVVMQRLPVQNNASNSIAASNKQISPNERNGSIKSNVNKAIKSFWDTDVESDLEATPVKKISPLKNGTPVSRQVVETVIESVPTMTKFLKPINDKLAKNKTTEDLQKQNAIVNQQKSKSVTNKSNKVITPKKTSSQNLIKMVNNNNSNKERKIVPPPSTKEISVKQAQQNPNKSVKTKVKKVLPKTGKENIEEPKQVESSNTANTTSKIKPKVDRQKTIKKSASNTTRNNDPQHLKVHNNTMRIREQRIPKMDNCDDSDEPVNNSTHYRSLRSRLVDLSSSINSSVDDTARTTKIAVKNKIAARLDSPNNKAENTLSSDLSLNLSLEKVNNIRNRKASARTKVIERKDRQSNVSFTLGSDEKLINNPKPTKITKRNKEIESLLNNSLSLFKCNKFPLTENQLLRSRRRPL